MQGPMENKTYRAEVTGYTSKGEGVARIEGRAVFLPGAIRGETCEIRIVKAGQNVCAGEIRRITVPSPHRTKPACPVYGRCGGCALMHMDYAEECEMKRQRVEDALRRIGGAELSVETILPSGRVTGYRNKAIFAVGSVNGAPVTGFYEPGSHTVVPAPACLIQSGAALRGAGAVREWMAENGVLPRDPKTGRGCVRHVFCRTAEKTGEAQIAVVTATRELPAAGDLVRRIRRACPEVTSIVHNVNPAAGNTVFGGTFRPLWGEAWIEDELCSLRFRLSAPSFYQVNRAQAEVLYETALELAELTGEDTALDLCCGTGTITLLLARRVKTAVGVEIVPEAVEDARENAARNGIENVRFFCADAAETAGILRREGLCPSVIVADPPRKGLPPEAVRAIGEVAPERLVYVSCDPATLARDVRLLSGFGYVPRRAVAVDLFPRTRHIETIVLLQKLNS